MHNKFSHASIAFVLNYFKARIVSGIYLLTKANHKSQFGDTDESIGIYKEDNISLLSHHAIAYIVHYFMHLPPQIYLRFSPLAKVGTCYPFVIGKR